MLNIHSDIKNKLEYFHSAQKIPNLILHGPSGSGKKTILYNFIDLIYNYDKQKIKQYVMFVNCAQGKGIKFIREEIKYFAKTHIHSNGGEFFKSIVLINADNFTVDAQSALRRCIELFSHSTRFFIVVEDKYKLLKPILSRFCEIYIPKPTLDNTTINNLYVYNIENTNNFKELKEKHFENLKKILSKKKITSQEICLDLSIKLYEKGFSGLNFIELFTNSNLFKHIVPKRKYELILFFTKIRKEIRSEKILLFIMLCFSFLDIHYCLENITFL